MSKQREMLIHDIQQTLPILNEGFEKLKSTKNKSMKKKFEEIKDKIKLDE